MSKPRQMIVVTVNKAKNTLSCYEYINGAYRLAIDPVIAYVGKNGATEQKVEGDGKTPLGIYPLLFVFGTADRVDTKMPYRKIRQESKWCCDGNHRHYNRWTHGEYISYEKLEDYPFEYALGCVVGYNYKHPMAGLGSAIFLHIAKGVTAGCIGVDKKTIKEILLWLNPCCKPHIYIKQKKAYT